MLVSKYSLFALILTGFNLLFQYFSFLLYSDVASLYVAMFFGTLAGLVTKYILDKNISFAIPQQIRQMMPKSFCFIHLWASLQRLSFGELKLPLMQCSKALMQNI